nr:hypothetical protein [Tanacetum cinerariifolium]
MEAGATTAMTVKLPILNPGEYNLWLMRIERYFLMTDYSLWEVIKNGNKVLTKTVGTSEQTYEPTTTEEKLDRRNEMKARGTLLMALPNKDQLKFHSYQDAKLFMKAIEKRNKRELETISLDDLNNLKIYEPELSRSSSTNQNPQNMAFISSNSTSNTNEADTTASGVSTAHTQGTTVNSTSVDNLIDDMICAFLASQPNSPQLAKEDLEQINSDDLEEMDLHWEMAMLTIRARRMQSFKEQDNRGRKYGRKTIQVETPTENALIAQDGIGGYDWNYQAEEEIPTNYAFMALASLGSSSSFDYEGITCPPKRDLRLIDEHFKSVFVDVIANIAPSNVKTVDHKLLTRPGKINTTGASVTTVVRPVNIVGSNTTMNLTRLISKSFKRRHTHDTRPFHKFSANRSNVFNKKVNIVRVNDSTARERAVVSGNMGREGNLQQKEYKEKGVIDSGCSTWKRLMIAKDRRCFVDTSEVTSVFIIPSLLNHLGQSMKGTACLLNESIFKGLARMSAKTTAWNEFSSTMASAIICLADNQKFNFSKYIFDNTVKILEGGVKFYLFPRFLQVFLDKQVEGMARHKEMYIISSYTKKIFANMRRIEAGFYRVITPLFDTMMVQAAADMGDTPVETQQTPIVDQPSTSKPQKKPKPRRKQRKEAKVSHDELEDGIMSLHLPVLDLQEAKTDQAKDIANLKKRVKKLERKRRSKTPVMNLFKIGTSRRRSLDYELAARLRAEEQRRKPLTKA